MKQRLSMHSGSDLKLLAAKQAYVQIVNLLIPYAVSSLLQGTVSTRAELKSYL